MKINLPILFFIACIATVPRPAFAYLDPGTGSMLIQLVVAGVLGAVFTVKTWWRYARDLIKGLISRGD